MNEYKVTVNDHGTIHWRNQEGQLHRLDGPAIEYADGRREWYLNALLHREDGPAIEFANISEYWYLNDKRHREYGPAIVWVAGTKSWYINGIELTEEEFNNRNNTELTLEDIANKFGINVNDLRIKK